MKFYFLPPKKFHMTPRLVWTLLARHLCLRRRLGGCWLRRGAAALAFPSHNGQCVLGVASLLHTRTPSGRTVDLRCLVCKHKCKVSKPMRAAIVRRYGAM
jgi:hypothetical protein